MGRKFFGVCIAVAMLAMACMSSPADAGLFSRIFGGGRYAACGSSGYGACGAGGDSACSSGYGYSACSSGYSGGYAACSSSGYSACSGSQMMMYYQAPVYVAPASQLPAYTTEPVSKKPVTRYSPNVEFVSKKVGGRPAKQAPSP